MDIFKLKKKNMRGRPLSSEIEIDVESVSKDGWLEPSISGNQDLREEESDYFECL